MLSVNYISIFKTPITHCRARRRRFPLVSRGHIPRMRGEPEVLLSTGRHTAHPLNDFCPGLCNLVLPPLGTMPCPVSVPLHRLFLGLEFQPPLHSLANASWFFRAPRTCHPLCEFSPTSHKQSYSSPPLGNHISSDACIREPLLLNLWAHQGFPGGSVVKNPPANAGDTGDAGSIPRSGRSPGGGNGNPLQCSCLGNPKDRLRSMGSQRVRRDWATEHKQGNNTILLKWSWARQPKTSQQRLRCHFLWEFLIKATTTSHIADQR